MTEKRRGKTNNYRRHGSLIELAGGGSNATTALTEAIPRRATVAGVTDAAVHASRRR